MKVASTQCDTKAEYLIQLNAVRELNYSMTSSIVIDNSGNNITFIRDMQLEFTRIIKNIQFFPNLVDQKFSDIVELVISDPLIS